VAIIYILIIVLKLVLIIQLLYLKCANLVDQTVHNVQLLTLLFVLLAQQALTSIMVLVSLHVQLKPSLMAQHVFPVIPLASHVMDLALQAV
jgi:hypothetical protein